MATATETFAVGAEQFTVAVEIDLNAVWLISGDFSGTIPNGQIGFINGDVNLTGDLIVEGLLTGIDTFTLTGNGFQILMQNGGQLNLQGVEKTAWMRWGDSPTNWQTGDRVAVAPTAAGVYIPSEIVWGAARPVNSPDVTLVDGSIARPGVVNLTQTVVLQNLRRIHFHDEAGVASLRWLRVLNCGTVGVLADYPLHFHLNGDASRGSLVEGVVVEGGKNHAFVPHGSHGIDFKECVAYNVKNHAYWWDPDPIGGGAGHDPTNDSHDIVWDRCLAMLVHAGPIPDATSRLSAYYLTWGNGNKCLGSVATCVQGGAFSSGFTWPETGSGVWEFRDCVGHNNINNGIFTWQNQGVHPVEDFTGTRNGKAGIAHGAYRNQYHYNGAVLTGNTVAVKANALSKPAPPSLLFEDMQSDGPLEIAKHNQGSAIPVIYRNCTFTQVLMRETTDNGVNAGFHQFQDCGLTPTDFDLTGIVPSSVIEIYEAGVMVHRWAGGSW